MKKMNGRSWGSNPWFHNFTGGDMKTQDSINEHGVNVSHFARKVNEWAKEQSRLLGRDVTFAEAFERWLDYVHPLGRGAWQR